MRMLILESSGPVASAAIIEDGRLVGECMTNYKKTHSETLLPMIDKLFQMTDLKKTDIECIGISSGPGSFTGLRIGIATAKGIALALDIPVVAVPTVDSIAMNIFGFDGIICPIMDARRSQVYTGLYTYDSKGFKVVSAQKAVMINEIIDEINSLGRSVIFLGDGVKVFRSVIEERCEVPVSWAPAHLNFQRAGASGILAYSYYIEGKSISSDELRPEYLRLAQAERELIEKNIPYDPDKF